MNFFSSRKQKEKYCYHIHGYHQCGYFRRAIQFGKKLESTNSNVEVTVYGVDVDDWKQVLEGKRAEYQSKRGDMGQHRTSPAIWEGCGGEYEEFVGGYTEFMKYAQTQQHAQ